jgi:hypothetical protein
VAGGLRGVAGGLPQAAGQGLHDDLIIARVFPRRTSATPDDEMAFVGDPPLFLPAVDEVHISCTFTWDKPEAERLARAWANCGYRVSIGGPAYDAKAGDFAPGMYVKTGMTITSRGCIRRCPFCFVFRREGALRLLPIHPGWDILDNNLLACPREHIEAVLNMLEVQPRAARFTGGIDARLCRPWFAKRLGQMRVQILYTAYDVPGARPHVERTVRMLRDAGLSQRQVGCYVLIGQDGDTMEHATARLEWVFHTGGTPFAMFYRPADDMRFTIPPTWRSFVRKWNRPACIFASHGGSAGSDMTEIAPVAGTSTMEDVLA